MAVRLIFPDLICSCSTGATLSFRVSDLALLGKMSWHALFRICGVDDYGVLGLVVNHQVGIVVTSPNP